MDISLMFLMIGAISDRSLSEQERQFALMLYKDYHPLIRAKVSKMVSNPSDRDDLIHNCYLQLLTHIDRLIPLKQPQLIRYIERVILTCCEQFRMHNPPTVCFEETPDAFSSDLTDSVGEQLDQKELCLDFHRQFEKLSEQDQRLLYLRYIEELSLEEIGKRLHLQPTSVNTQLCRVRKRARQLIHQLSQENKN